MHIKPYHIYHVNYKMSRGKINVELESHSLLPYSLLHGSNCFLNRSKPYNGDRESVGGMVVGKARGKGSGSWERNILRVDQ